MRAIAESAGRGGVHWGTPPGRRRNRCSSRRQYRIRPHRCAATAKINRFERTHRRRPAVAPGPTDGSSQIAAQGVGAMGASLSDAAVASASLSLTDAAAGNAAVSPRDAALTRAAASLRAADQARGTVSPRDVARAVASSCDAARTCATESPCDAARTRAAVSPRDLARTRTAASAVAPATLAPVPAPAVSHAAPAGS